MLEVFIREMWKLLRWVLTRVGERDVAAVGRREAHPIITTTHTSLSHRPIPGLTKNNVPITKLAVSTPMVRASRGVGWRGLCVIVLKHIIGEIKAS